MNFSCPVISALMIPCGKTTEKEKTLRMKISKRFMKISKMWKCVKLKSVSLLINFFYVFKIINSLKIEKGEGKDVDEEKCETKVNYKSQFNEINFFYN